MVILKTIVQIIWNGWNKMKKEYWKPVVEYEGLYMVSNWGRIKSFDTYRKGPNGSIRICKGRILKPVTTKDGYLKVTLCKNGKKKTFKVHKLVAEAFLEIPEELKHLKGTRYLQVNHKDENKLNNNVENLEFCDCKYNINYGTRIERVAKKNTNGKCSKKVYQYTLDGKFVKEWKSTRECNRNGYNHGAVAACCRGKQKTHKGFIWKYK